jgi:hypothetical protein
MASVLNEILAPNPSFRLQLKLLRMLPLLSRAVELWMANEVGVSVAVGGSLGIVIKGATVSLLFCNSERSHGGDSRPVHHVVFNWPLSGWDRYQRRSQVAA